MIDLYKIDKNELNEARFSLYEKSIKTIIDGIITNHQGKHLI